MMKRWEQGRAVSHRTNLPKATGPLGYRDVELAHQEPRDFRRVLKEQGDGFADAFITAPSPGFLLDTIKNEFYNDEDSYLDALAAAMRVEYQAIVDAGESLKTNKKIRAVVLSGEGASFCAGLDLSSMGGMANGGERNNGEKKPSAGDMEDGRITHLGQQSAWVWQEVPVPVIASDTGGHAETIRHEVSGLLFDLDNAELTQSIYDNVVLAFEEDRTMIEAQQKIISQTPDRPMIPIWADSGLSQARWLIDRALKAEQTTTHTD